MSQLSRRRKCAAWRSRLGHNAGGFSCLHGVGRMPENEEVLDFNTDAD